LVGEALFFGPWVVFIVALAGLLISRGRWFPRTSRGQVIAGVVWILLIQGDSIVLGPRARLEWGDGEMLFFGYFRYLASADGSLFLADLIGGTDRYAVGRIGGAIVSLRLMLIDVLPFWLVVVLLRVVTTATAFVSVYLFARRRLNCPSMLAFALGALVAAGFDVNASMTFLYAISIAALPLILLFLVSLNARLAPWIGFVAFAIVYASLADPFFWLPLMWLAAILLLFWHRPNSYGGFAAGLVLLTVLWVANYAEAIFAVLQFVPVSGRDPDFLAAPFGERLLLHAKWMLSTRWQYNQGGWPYIFPVAFALYVAWRAGSRTTLLAALSAIVVGFASPFLIAFPWSALGLEFLQSYRWYLEYGSFPLAMLAAAQAGAVLHARATTGAKPRALPAITAPATVCLAIGLAMVASMKLNTIPHMATRGNLSVHTNIPNLRDADWYSGESRVVGLPTRYPPNASPSYGLASFDGGATFVPRTLVEYWRKLVLKRDLPVTGWGPGFPSLAEYNDCCAPYPIERDASLDMLRVANVGYIISYRALASPNLRLVSGPERQFDEGRIARILDSAKPVHVYEIADPLPRIYGARSVEIAATDSSDDAFAETVRARAPGRAAVIRAGDAEGFGATPWSATDEPAVHAVTDGFDIDLAEGAGGTILVNVPPLPWWQATGADGARLEVRPANIGQLAIAVPQGHATVRLRYARPTLLEKSSDGD
jgi:hypothetical protein